MARRNRGARPARKEIERNADRGFGWIAQRIGEIILGRAGHIDDASKASEIFALIVGIGGLEADRAQSIVAGRAVKGLLPDRFAGCVGADQRQISAQIRNEAVGHQLACRSSAAGSNNGQLGDAQCIGFADEIARAVELRAGGAENGVAEDLASAASAHQIAH